MIKSCRTSARARAHCERVYLRWRRWIKKNKRLNESFDCRFSKNNWTIISLYCWVIYLDIYFDCVFDVNPIEELLRRRRRL